MDEERACEEVKDEELTALISPILAIKGSPFNKLIIIFLLCAGAAEVESIFAFFRIKNTAI